MLYSLSWLMFAPILTWKKVPWKSEKIAKKLWQQIKNITVTLFTELLTWSWRTWCRSCHNDRGTWHPDHREPAGGAAAAAAAPPVSGAGAAPPPPWSWSSASSSAGRRRRSPPRGWSWAAAPRSPPRWWWTAGCRCSSGPRYLPHLDIIITYLLRVRRCLTYGGYGGQARVVLLRLRCSRQLPLGEVATPQSARRLRPRHLDMEIIK